jgi:hypothetical protein
MRKKIKNLKNGDVFVLEMPDGTKKTSTMLCQAMLRGAKNIKITRPDGVITFPVDTYVEVVMHAAVDKVLLDEYMQAYSKEKREKRNAVQK